MRFVKGARFVKGRGARFVKGREICQGARDLSRGARFVKGGSHPPSSPPPLNETLLIILVRATQKRK